MTKYYVGYLQGNDEYVYVTNIDIRNGVRVTPIINEGIGFDNLELAEALLSLSKSMVLNQDFVVLKVRTNIEEVK